MKLQEIRDALATTIRAALVAQPATKDFNVYAYNTGALRLPCVVVEPVADEFLSYYETMGDARLGDVRLQLRVAVPVGASPETAQRLLDDLIGQGSGTALGVVDIFADGSTTRTLGGVVQVCVPLTCTDYGPGSYGDEAIPFYGATVPLMIRTRRS